MTTIAFKGGVMAADTRTTAGTTIVPGRATKVLKLHDGSLIGGAGNADECYLLAKAVEHGYPTPELEHCEALHVRTDGSLWEYQGKTWVKVNSEFYAIGTGWVPACVAMRFGADARTAVQTAMEFDSHTGGDVDVIALDPTQPKKRTRKRVKA